MHDVSDGLLVAGAALQAPGAEGVVALAFLGALPVPMVHCDIQVMALSFRDHWVRDGLRDLREAAATLGAGEPGEQRGIYLESW